jgi:hypothetical protein
MGRERRRYRRVPVDWAAVVKHTSGGIVAEMENIGANGAFIRCEKPLRPKERFMLHIMAPNHSRSGVAAGTLRSERYTSVWYGCSLHQGFR